MCKKTIAWAAAATIAATLTACSSSSSSSSDNAAPQITTIVQDRDFDVLGQTIDITFDDNLDQAIAETIGNYTISGGINVTAAVLQIPTTTVRLTLDAAAIPGTHTIDVSGIEDTSGNTLVAVTAQPITSTDAVAPNASSIAGLTIEGPENDTLTVIFNDHMVTADVTTHANWNVESPLGTGFDITGATITYDAGTMTATVTLDAGSADKNLHTFDDVHASFMTMRDLGGNAITATTIGVDAVNGFVTGDTTLPTIIVAAPGGGNTLNLRFSEHCTYLETADLIATVPIFGTRIVLTDVSDPGTAASGTFALAGRVADGDGIVVSDGATSVDFEFDYGGFGTIAISGQPNDGDSITLDDDGNTESFEFDDNGSSGSNPVLIGATPADTMSNLFAAINAAGFNITAYPGGSPLDIIVINDGTGSDGNIPITNNDTAFVQVITGMAGGGVAPGAVETSAVWDDDAQTVTNLRSEIDGDGFDVSTSAGGSTTDFVISNDSTGVDGNVAITETDTNASITVTGMAGGIDPSTLTVVPMASTAADAGLGAIVTYSVAPEDGDEIELYGVTDLAGNPLFPQMAEDVINQDASQPSLSIGDSDLTVRTGERNDIVTVKFDRPMQPFGLLDPTNYSLDPGTAVDLSTAAFDFDGDDEVTITFMSPADHNIQFAGTYDLAINNVTTAQGVTRTVADTETSIAPIGDSLSPMIAINGACLDPQDANSILVTFNEAVDEVAAENAGNYLTEGIAATGAMLIAPRVVRVTFAVPPLAADNLMISSVATTDLAGNMSPSPWNLAVCAADMSPPLVTSVTGNAKSGDANDTIFIDFNEQLELTSALTAANYTVINYTPFDITGSMLTWDSTNNRVTIWLPAGAHLNPAMGLDVAPSGVKDPSGNAIFTSTTIGLVVGDTSDPDIDSAFVDFRTDVTGATVAVQFDEEVNSMLATDSVNWSASGGQTVMSVTMLTDASTYRVILDAALGSSDTLTASGMEDLAQNAAASLVIDPVE